MKAVVLLRINTTNIKKYLIDALPYILKYLMVRLFLQLQVKLVDKLDPDQ